MPASKDAEQVINNGDAGDMPRRLLPVELRQARLTPDATITITSLLILRIARVRIRHKVSTGIKTRLEFDLCI